MSTLSPRRRNHSFHKAFLPEDFRRIHASTWTKQWQGLRGAELCARMVLSVHQSLFGKFWHNGKRDTPAFSPGDESATALQILARHKVRAFPESAAQALQRWANGEIELQVFRSLPRPEEVLELQAQGIRCISVLTEAQDIIGFQCEGRDFFSFMVHDLIHAQLMTADVENYRHQIKFALWLRAEWPVLVPKLNPEGRRELEYMASDMNSHIIHLLKTFKSWVQRHRPELLDRSRWLGGFNLMDDSIEASFQLHWRKLNLTADVEAEATHRELLRLWQALPVHVITTH